MIRKGIGASLLGFSIGFATGLSKTPGTTKRAITILSGLVGGGGVIGWLWTREDGILIIAGISLGFVLGIVLGAVLRQSGVLHTLLPL